MQLGYVKQRWEEMSAALFRVLYWNLLNLKIFALENATLTEMNFKCYLIWKSIKNTTASKYLNVDSDNIDELINYLQFYTWILVGGAERAKRRFNGRGATTLGVHQWWSDDIFQLQRQHDEKSQTGTTSETFFSLLESHVQFAVSKWESTQREKSESEPACECEWWAQKQRHIGEKRFEIELIGQLEMEYIVILAFQKRSSSKGWQRAR